MCAILDIIKLFYLFIEHNIVKPLIYGYLATTKKFDGCVWFKLTKVWSDIFFNFILILISLIYWLKSVTLIFDWKLYVKIVVKIG